MDIDDILYRTANDPDPSNSNGLHDQSLLCVTDLVDCCTSPYKRGDWYYPDGRRIVFDTNGWNAAFRRNRGRTEIINGQQFYGSVRLFRRWTPTQRGRFRCELPSAADPGVNQILYANICELTINKDIIVYSQL